MKKLCDRCGGQMIGGIGMGGALLCLQCSEDIRPEISALRAEGRPVNVLQIARAYYRQHYAGGSYLLRDIPADLETAWKERAVRDGCNQRDVVLAALSSYLV